MKLNLDRRTDGRTDTSSLFTLVEGENGHHTDSHAFFVVDGVKTDQNDSRSQIDSTNRNSHHVAEQRQFAAVGSTAIALAFGLADAVIL